MVSFSGGKGLPKTKKFNNKNYALHSTYTNAKGQAKDQKNRWHKEGYLVRLVTNERGTIGLYRRKKRK